MKEIRSILVVIGILLLATVSRAEARESIVNFSDVLEISVFGHPEMATTVRVDGQGMVLLPLLNQVKVQGLTISQASAHIAKLLAAGYIVNPQVNVFVKNFREYKASILGQVVKPGVYDVNQKTTLLELVSMAGGLTPEAGDRATLKRESGREGEGGTQEIIIELKRLVDQGDASQNVAILDGDKVFIVKAGLFYVTGQVKKPDSYKYQDKLTVIKAITMAGGFSNTASKGSVRIVRKVNGKELEITGAEMDALVQPDDVIVVPESFF